MFDITVVFDNTGPLMDGLWMTTWISLLSIGIGFVAGIILCLGRMSKNKFLSTVTRVYISAFRGTPLLIQLSFVFYLLPAIGITLSSIPAAILALSMNTAAFQAEILRGGFRIHPKGQKEASWCFGLSAWQNLYHIELPQVVRRTIPSLINETIDIIKNSSLISTIAVTDLMRIAQTYSSTTYRPLEFFIAAGVLYLLLTFSVSVIGKRVEARFSAY